MKILLTIILLSIPVLSFATDVIYSGLSVGSVVASTETGENYVVTGPRQIAYVEDMVRGPNEPRSLDYFYNKSVQLDTALSLEAESQNFDGWSSPNAPYIVGQYYDVTDLFHYKKTTFYYPAAVTGQSLDYVPMSRDSYGSADSYFSHPPPPPPPAGGSPIDNLSAPINEAAYVAGTNMPLVLGGSVAVLGALLAFRKMKSVKAL